MKTEIYLDQETNIATYYQDGYAVATLNRNSDVFETFEEGLDEKEIYDALNDYNLDSAFTAADYTHFNNLRYN